MIKTLQFKLSPTHAQLKAFFRQLDAHRELYNLCLDERKALYEKDKSFISCFDQIKSNVPKFRGRSNYSALQQTVRRLDKSYKSFFRDPSSVGLPRFKKRFRTIDYAKHGDGCKLGKDYIYLQYVGKVKCRFHTSLPEDMKINTLSATFKDGGLHVSVVLEKETCVFNNGSNAVGIDFGLQSTMTLSNGDKIVSPRFLKSKEKDIKRLQRKQKRCPNNKKVGRAIGKCWTKVKNRRKDFNHKLSRRIVDEFDVICIEDLRTKEVVSNIANVNKKWNDLAIHQIKTMLRYKAENAGKKAILVDPKYTTQTCSQCRSIVAKPLSERIHECSCGLTMDRDVNAANNILRLGLESLTPSLAIAEVEMCGSPRIYSGE